MKKIEWDWYGTWIVDWLTCAREEPWESYDIWEKAYLKANPELEDLSWLDLIHDHYSPAMEPVFNSLIMKIWLLLSWPSNTIRSFVWNIKRKFS